MLLRIAVALSAFALSSPVYAEVADKEPSLGSLWAWALGFNVLALVLAVVRPWLGYLAVILASASAWVLHLELTDPYVGPAIRRELGKAYVDTTYLTAGIGVVGSLLIVLFCQVRRRKA